jgi:hypothetical protein
MTARIHGAMVLAAMFIARSVLAQSIDYDGAIRDAAQRFRGDFPSRYEVTVFRDYKSWQADMDRASAARQRTEARKRYMDAATARHDELERMRATIRRLEKSP